MRALDRLAATIASRIGGDPSASWTARLLGDPGLAAKKLGEEAAEAIIEATRLAAGRGDTGRLTSEAADAVYHLLVLCASQGVTLADIETELARRETRSGIEEKAAR